MRRSVRPRPFIEPAESVTMLCPPRPGCPASACCAGALARAACDPWDAAAAAVSGAWGVLLEAGFAPRADSQGMHSAALGPVGFAGAVMPAPGAHASPDTCTCISMTIIIMIQHRAGCLHVDVQDLARPKSICLVSPAGELLCIFSTGQDVCASRMQCTVDLSVSAYPASWRQVPVQNAHGPSLCSSCSLHAIAANTTVGEGAPGCS